jgi:hypothetical protein
MCVFVVCVYVVVVMNVTVHIKVFPYMHARVYVLEVCHDACVRVCVPRVCVLRVCVHVHADIGDDFGCPPASGRSVLPSASSVLGGSVSGRVLPPGTLVAIMYFPSPCTSA